VEGKEAVARLVEGVDGGNLDASVAEGRLEVGHEGEEAYGHHETGDDPSAHPLVVEVAHDVAFHEVPVDLDHDGLSPSEVVAPASVDHAPSCFLYPSYPPSRPFVVAAAYLYP
jgi:hypothetical protein